MERLTDKDTNKVCFDTWELCGLDSVCKRDCYKPTPCKIPKMIHRLAELEDKLESGQLVELPCKVGDILYAIMDVDYKYQIVQFKATNIELGMYGEVYFNTPTCYSHKLTFGKSVFGDKAQAEARLKELQEK